MGTRALTRLGLENALLERLHSKSLRVSKRQALSLHGSQMHTSIQLELTEMLDVAPAAASALLLAVSRSVVGEPSTVGCSALPEAEVGLLALGASRAPYGASRCSNLCTRSLKRMVCDAPAR